MSGRAAVFLDRDGTISEEVGYVNHLSRYRLMPRSAEAIRMLNEAGYLTFLTTNQSGVARGYFSDTLLHTVHEKLQRLLAAEGARLDGLYVCPHHPEEGQPPWRTRCDCRKPQPGMILRAAREHGLDLARSWAIGDSVVDIQAAAAAGVRGILVLTGYGRGLVEHQPQRFTVRPAHTAEDLVGAVRYILEQDGRA
jgi:D-glycero-D-manno-heptose 1,7-bisphosphate phosphatase